MDTNIKYSSFENKFEVIHRNEKPTYLMPPHTHNAIEIYLSISSLPNILLGSNVMPIKENTLLIIPSYCVHQFTQLLDCEYERYIITVSASWLEHFMADNPRYKYLTDTKHPLVISPDKSQISLLINRINKFTECKNDDTFSEMSVLFEILKTVDDLVHTSNLNENKINDKHTTGTRKTVEQIIKIYASEKSPNNFI